VPPTLEDEYDEYDLKGFFKNWSFRTFKKRVPYYIPVLG